MGNELVKKVNHFIYLLSAGNFLIIISTCMAAWIFLGYLKTSPEQAIGMLTALGISIVGCGLFCRRTVIEGYEKWVKRKE